VGLPAEASAQAGVGVDNSLYQNNSNRKSKAKEE
jgi:hypothetical protein